MGCSFKMPSLVYSLHDGYFDDDDDDDDDELAYSLFARVLLLFKSAQPQPFRPQHGPQLAYTAWTEVAVAAG